MDSVNTEQNISEEVIQEEVTNEQVVEEQNIEEIAEEMGQEQTEEVYCGYKIVTEPPNEVNEKMRVIIATMHGTHVKEWIIGEEGIQKAKDYINGAV